MNATVITRNSTPVLIRCKDFQEVCRECKKMLEQPKFYNINGKSPVYVEIAEDECALYTVSELAGEVE